MIVRTSRKTVTVTFFADPRRQKLIAGVLEDVSRLSNQVSDRAGAPRRGVRSARSDLRLVHRGLDTTNLKDAKALLDELA